MPSLKRTTGALAALVLALLISGGGSAFAETSPAGGCGWARPTAFSKPKRPKFSLGVALRIFSFSKAPASTPTHTDNTPSAELELRDLERIESELSFQAAQLGLQPPPKGLPRVFSWMRGWRLEKDRGLFRPIRSRSRFALAYSDIFETNGDPEKGGHGLSLLLRRDLN